MFHKARSISSLARRASLLASAYGERSLLNDVRMISASVLMSNMAYVECRLLCLGL